MQSLQVVQLVMAVRDKFRAWLRHRLPPARRYKATSFRRYSPWLCFPLSCYLLFRLPILLGQNLRARPKLSDGTHTPICHQVHREPPAVGPRLSTGLAANSRTTLPLPTAKFRRIAMQDPTQPTTATTATTTTTATMNQTTARKTTATPTLLPTLSTVTTVMAGATMKTTATPQAPRQMIHLVTGRKWSGPRSQIPRRWIFRRPKEQYIPATPFMVIKSPPSPTLDDSDAATQTTPDRFLRGVHVVVALWGIKRWPCWSLDGKTSQEITITRYGGDNSVDKTVWLRRR